MTQVPTLKARRLIKIVTRLGFMKVRQEGSHVFFKHPDGRTTVVPIHAGKDIGKGLLHAILDDINVTPKEFQKLL